MPQSEFVSAVRAVDWHDLEATYESGEIVRDIVLGLHRVMRRKRN